jgi:hypothetical protein
MEGFIGADSNLALSSSELLGSGGDDGYLVVVCTATCM